MRDGESFTQGASRLQKQIIKRQLEQGSRESGEGGSDRAAGTERARGAPGARGLWGPGVGRLQEPVPRTGATRLEGQGGDAGRLTCPPRRWRCCGSRRPSAAPTCRWAAPGSGWCSSARETARRSPAPRTAARCVPSRPPAVPLACWGAAGGLVVAERGRAGQPVG